MSVEFSLPMAELTSFDTDCTMDKAEKSDGKKKANKPKRPLSAYNLFFRDARARILRETPERPGGKPARSHGKIGFATLARTVSSQWKNIDPSLREEFEIIADRDKARYRREMEQWKLTQGNVKTNSKSGIRQINEMTRCGGSGTDVLSSFLFKSPSPSRNSNYSPPMKKLALSMNDSNKFVQPVLDVSELAERLDDECINFLCSMKLDMAELADKDSFPVCRNALSA